METQKTFASFKKYLVEAGKEKGACADEYRKLLKSETMEDLFQVIKSNLNWCCKNEIINSKILLKNVELEELNSLGFYVSQEIKELTGNQIVWLFDTKVSEMWGNSQVSEMWENSQVSEMRENSQVSVMWGNSQVSVMWGNSTRKEFKTSTPKIYFKKGAFEIVELD